MARGNRIVVLDRDGVINEDSADYICGPGEWRPITGSLEAIVKWKNAGYRVFVASNQSGLARGLFSYDDLFAIHDKMTRMLADLGSPVDGIFFCPHGPDDGCVCRKPRTGLLEDIARRVGRSLEGVSFIGDRESDYEAARAAGMRPVLLRSGLEPPNPDRLTENTPIYADLAAATQALLAERVAGGKRA